MKFSDSQKIRIITSALIISATILILKLIFGLIPVIIPIILPILIPALLIRTINLKQAIIIGLITGILTGLISSILFLAPLVGLTIYLIAFCIIGMLLSLFLTKKVKEE